MIFAWLGLGRQRLLVPVNYAPNQRNCYVRLPFSDLAGSKWRFLDQLTDVVYERDGSELASRGLYLDTSGWYVSTFELINQ
jgi:hypothetical protein